MCGDCIYYPICGQWVEESETCPEIEGGCKVFKSKSDFVEVVRCRECANSFFNRQCNTFFCMLGMPNKVVSVKPNHFCGYGERKNDG